MIERASDVRSKINSSVSPLRARDGFVGFFCAIDPDERFLAFGRDLRLLGSMLGSLLNFGSPHIGVDPGHADRYVIEISDESAYPDVLGWANQSFSNRMAERHGSLISGVMRGLGASG